MLQADLETILRQTTSKAIECHLYSHQSVILDKATFRIKDGICRSGAHFIPCSEVSHISIVTPELKPKIKRKPVSQEIRLKLWQELKECGYKALFSGRVITKEALMNHDLVTIEHIVPLAQKGSDCVENMTLEFVDTNNARGSLLPSQYKKRLTKAERKRYNHDINKLYQKKMISKEKFRNLIR